MKLSLTDTEVFWEIMLMLSKIYRHPDCPDVLKTYIHLECRRYFNEEWDIKHFLENGE